MKIVSGVIQNAFEYWKISDVFIRPTTTDIEGISVKEALWVNTPAIASDVCERPAGTLLFENRNYLDLKDKVLKIYKKDKYETIDFRENVPDVVNEILKIYNSRPQIRINHLGRSSCSSSKIRLCFNPNDSYASIFRNGAYARGVRKGEPD